MAMAAILAAAAPVGHTSANHGDDSYGTRWSSTGTESRNVVWSFDNNFPAQVSGLDTTRAAAITGGSAWTTQTPETWMKFDYESGDYLNMDWDTDCSDEAGATRYDYYQLNS